MHGLGFARLFPSVKKERKRKRSGCIRGTQESCVNKEGRSGSWIPTNFSYTLFCPASCRRELMYQVSSQATKGPPSLPPPPSSYVVRRGNPVSLPLSPSPLEPVPCANVIVRARYKTSLPCPPSSGFYFFRRRGYEAKGSFRSRFCFQEGGGGRKF